MSKGERPSKIGDTEKRLLHQLVEETPLATLDEITEAFRTRTGLSVHHMTVRRRLDEMGIRREQATPPPPEVATEKRYGYRSAHRRHQPEQHYTSSLTDEEWRLVADIFESDGDRGTPPRYSRRLLVSMHAGVWSAVGARGECCPGTFRPGRTCTGRFADGANRASLSRCTTGYARNGESVRGATRCPAPPFWMLNRHGVRRKVERVATMPGRRSRPQRPCPGRHPGAGVDAGAISP